MKKQIAEVDDAVLDEEHDQIAAGVAAADEGSAHRLAADGDLVTGVEGLVRHRRGGRAGPVAGVEGVHQILGALRRDDAGARREARVPMRVVGVVVGVEDHGDFAAGDPLGFFADALALHAEGHRVDDHGAALGAQHADVAADAEENGDVVGDLLGVERRDF